MRKNEEHMNDSDDSKRTPPKQRQQRGAALILTVVVIMVLTTLGIAMVAFTVTEERSAVAYRDTLQARMIAEAGVRIVQMAFATPSDRALVPLYSAVAAPSGTTPKAYDYYGLTEADTETALNALGIYRASRGLYVPPRYTGAGNRFFAGPFGGAGGWGSAFGGTYVPSTSTDTYDLRFTRKIPGTNTDIADNWLDTNINALLQTAGDWNLTGGKITDISFYGAPATGGIQYGITTVRVTAEKRAAWPDGELLARETVEAIIGDSNPKPAVLGNGNVKFITQGGEMCGDGCEQIHANGNIQVGTISGGENPMVTATGTIAGGSGSTQVLPTAVVTPEINPWDLSYRPTANTELAAYYLLAARPLDAVWTDGNPATPANKAGWPCGLGVPQLSRCQDYNLEYDSAGVAKAARTAASVPYMYRWDTANNEWSATGCTSGVALSCGAGTPSFNVIRAADAVVAGTGDNNDIPFNILRVPKTKFDLQTPVDGSTILVDGMFVKTGGGMAPIMSVIAVGSMTFSSSTTWFPAMANRVMWMSGRDIDVQANCCAPSNTCATNLANNAAQSIVAVHEQLFSQSQTALAGIVIAENRVNYDTIVNSATQAIDITKGDHSYSCGLPDWPWELPTKPAIFSLKSATN
jgi:hypothetical protein